MASTINASNTGVGGLVQTADNTGILVLQGASVTGFTIDATGSPTVNNLINITDKVTINATSGATGTINFDIGTQSVLYYTVSAAANWTVNFRYSSANTLNNSMATGQAVTAVFMATQNSTSTFYNNLIQIDGSNTTAKWQGGSAPTVGYSGGIDSYGYTIMKTANATFTVMASLTQFK